jgi:very-short-patch-repair endonuclease
MKQTNIDRYGCSCSAQNEQVRKKIEKTIFSIYGTTVPFKSPKIKEKIKDTNLKRYGVENPAKTEEVKARARATCMKHYGVEYSQQAKEVRERGYETAKKNRSFEKSGEEEIFGEYLCQMYSDTERHVRHPVIGHIIDFYIPTIDLWIQFDGAYWHGKLKRDMSTRRAKKIQGTMLRDQKENETIPNLIRFWSDDVKSAIKSNTLIGLIAEKIKTIQEKLK